MKINQFHTATLHKFRNPATWVAIAIYGLSWAAARIFLTVPYHFRPWMEFVVPFMFLTAQVALAPLPWLWTGDDRPGASPGRGLLQAIPWNFFWILGLVGFMTLFRGDYPRLPEDIRFHAFGIDAPLRAEWVFLLVNFPLALILGLFLADKERAESSERTLKRLADRTRAQVLQAQLNPHVLFNVLGGLAELVHEDPDAAESAIIGLTRMYRELTTHAVAATASLRAERNLIECYLEIEEMRLGERLEVLWDWPTWAEALAVPPLLLQPLVENAIKHGIAPSPKGGLIRISVERRPSQLVLRVANTGAALAANAQDGTGLGNLKERLKLMSEFKPTLDLVSREGCTHATLTLIWPWPA